MWNYNRLCFLIDVYLRYEFKLRFIEEITSISINNNTRNVEIITPILIQETSLDMIDPTVKLYEENKSKY